MPGVDVRRHGSLVVHAGGVSERQRAHRLDRSPSGGQDRRIDLRRQAPGVGYWRHCLRHHGRPGRTREDHGHHRAHLLGLHRRERPSADLVAAPGASGLGRRRHRRRMGGRRRADRRNLAGADASACAGDDADVLRRWIFLRRTLEFRDRPNRMALGVCGRSRASRGGACDQAVRAGTDALDRSAPPRLIPSGASPDGRANVSGDLRPGYFSPHRGGRADRPAMMVGAWGTTTLLPIWIHQLVGADDVEFAIKATGKGFMLANVGAVFGYLVVMWVNDALGRRWSYFLVVVGCFATSLFAFTQIATIQGLPWFMPLYGFFAIGGFATFAVYLPELFPTRIRATGQGFCWNMGRTLTAAGPLISGALVGAFGSVPTAATVVAASYLIGTIAIWFGPETRGLPLPD